MVSRSLLVALVASLAGCGVLQPAEPIGADERYVCKAGSALKYRKPIDAGWPEYWLPRGPGGTCKHN